MENTEKEPLTQREKDRDNATKQTYNSEKSTAPEINRGDAKSKTYMGKGESKNNGPNYDEKSEGVEGDSGQNAGVFK
ncbi:hypothetical protein [Mucilaginibacter sp.]|uniref:hypothetical protein n=1 Tax=Mucilaginibacter sp. TaxID=1882438 RepID=UPI003D14F1B5